MKLRSLLLALALTTGFAAAEDLKVGALTFKSDAPWKTSAKAKPMSQGGFTLPGKDGAADLEAVFYHFGKGQGGDLDANVKRWQGMFTPEPAAKLDKEEFAFGDKKATLVSITGTYKGSAFSPVPPAADNTLLAAVIPSDEGDVYVRMVGPAKDIAAAKDPFKKLLLTAKK